MLKCLIPLTICLALTSAAGAEPSPRVIAGFKNPESVLFVGERRFVSNLGEKLDPTSKDGDGFISELDKSGRIVAMRAFPPLGVTLDAPKGMAAIGATLYVADIDRVVGFDIATRRQVFEAKAPAGGPTLLNDLAVMNEAALLVSDTLRDSVYRLRLPSGAFDLVAKDVPGANGLVYDAASRRIYVNGVGPHFSGGDVFVIEPGQPPRKLEGGPHGVLDGLALTLDGRLLVSDWRGLDGKTPGAILATTPEGGTTTQIQTGRDIVGPADFAVDGEANEIWIPAMVEGTVVIAPLPPR